MRKLKYHEKKLIKKVNFLEWKREGNHRENEITYRYHMGSRDDYKKLVPLFALKALFYLFFFFWFECFVMNNGLFLILENVFSFGQVFRIV